MFAVIDHLILMSNRATAFFHDEVFHPAVGSWGDFPFPLEIKLTILLFGDNIPAATLANMLDAVVFDDPSFIGKSFFFESAPWVRVFAIE